jgi:hypothetical protein
MVIGNYMGFVDGDDESESPVLNYMFMCTVIGLFVLILHLCKGN